VKLYRPTIFLVLSLLLVMGACNQTPKETLETLIPTSAVVDSLHEKPATAMLHFDNRVPFMEFKNFELSYSTWAPHGGYSKMIYRESGLRVTFEIDVSAFRHKARIIVRSDDTEIHYYSNDNSSTNYGYFFGDGVPR
jgi:ABC-type uncharacterized transport system auxiliary subunit